MGNGQTSPGIDLDSRGTIDDGTLGLNESPPPGPIGLDAKNGSAKGGTASLADRILSYARRKRGDHVGDGQCYAFADSALTHAGGRSARDYGDITPDADYVWGTAVTLADLQPGDVIQFRNYSYERQVVTERSDETVTRDEAGDRPHHTAIVQSVDGDGAVTVWEQNAPDGSAVTRAQLFFTSGTFTHGNVRTTIRVRGTFSFYRPVAR